jgi:hypothetical protein
MVLKKTKRPLPARDERPWYHPNLSLNNCSIRPSGSDNGELPFGILRQMRMFSGLGSGNLHTVFSLMLKDPFSLLVSPVHTNHRLSEKRKTNLLVPIIAN